jgi:hypothetical protein
MAAHHIRILIVIPCYTHNKTIEKVEIYPPRAISHQHPPLYNNKKRIYALFPPIHIMSCDVTGPPFVKNRSPLSATYKPQTLDGLLFNNSCKALNIDYQGQLSTCPTFDISRNLGRRTFFPLMETITYKETANN